LEFVTMTTKKSPARTLAAKSARTAARDAKKAAEAARESADLKEFQDKLDAMTPEDLRRERAEWEERVANGHKADLYLCFMNDPAGLTVVRDIVGQLTRDAAADLTDYEKVRPNLLAALVIVEGVEQVRDYSLTQAM